MTIFSALDVLLFLFFCQPYLVRVEAIGLPICSLLALISAALIVHQFFHSVDEQGRPVHESLRVDHTDTLILLTEISFGCALTIAFLGLANEIVNASWEWYFAFKSRFSEEKTLKDEENLEQLFLEVAKKKKNRKEKLTEKTPVVENRKKTSSPSKLERKSSDVPSMTEMLQIRSKPEKKTTTNTKRNDSSSPRSPSVNMKIDNNNKKNEKSGSVDQSTTKRRNKNEKNNQETSFNRKRAFSEI